MSYIKHRDLGRVLCYDVFHRDGDKLCEALMIYHPIPGELSYTIDLRLHYTASDGGEYFYNIDKQSITASSLDIETKCDRLFNMLLHHNVFWGHVNDFMEVIPK